MRGIIKFSATAFIIVGIAVFALAALIVLLFIYGVAQSGDGLVGAVGLMAALGVAAGGALAGASIILIGGATYMLVSIDERMQSGDLKAKASAL